MYKKLNNYIAQVKKRIFSPPILPSGGSGNYTYITIPAQTPGTDIQPAIQAAVNGAVDGTMILLPIGSYIVNNKITISGKNISFKGAGLLETILTRSEGLSDAALTALNEMVLYNNTSTASSNVLIENIYFKSQVPEFVAADGGSLATDIAIKLVKVVDFKIKNCRFDYFGNAAIEIRHHDSIARGLITGCTFYKNFKGATGSGLGYGVAVYGQNLAWMDHPEFGTNNFVFIENCSFDWHRHSVAGGGNGRYVARYNTITNNIIGASSSVHALDAHAARGGALGDGNYFSTRAIEAYNNTITNTKYWNGTAAGGATINPVSVPDVGNMTERCIMIRGGESITHHNNISGYRFGIGMVTDYTPWGTTYPLPYCAGYNPGGESELGVFHYSNTFQTYDDSFHSSCIDFYNYGQAWYQLNRDWHLNIKTGYTTYTYPHPLA